jgi:hypothetical protein
MKNIVRSVIMVVLLCLGANSYAQDYAKVDAVVKNYPPAFSDTHKLAAQISKDFYRQDEKARALYTWLGTNVRYDTSPAAAGRKPSKFSYTTQAERRTKIAAIENDMADKTLSSKKGVCNGYAMLFKVVSSHMGMESEVVYGTAKAIPADIGKLPAGINRAWNAVKVNGYWKLLDVTWGAGGMGDKGTAKFDDNYFFTDPGVFFLNHFPDDKRWLLTGKSESEFAALPLYYSLGYEMVSPLHGIIKTGTSRPISFRVRGIKKTDEVMYQYTSGAFSNKVLPKISSGVGEFNLVLDNNAKGIFTIFINRKQVAAYKLTSS